MNDEQVKYAVGQQFGVEPGAVSVSKWRLGQAPWMFFDRPPVSSGRVVVYNRQWEFTSDGTKVSLYRNISAVVNNDPTVREDQQLTDDREAYENAARVSKRRAELRQLIADRHLAA
jgi:hypothetical protein